MSYQHIILCGIKTCQWWRIWTYNRHYNITQCKLMLTVNGICIHTLWRQRGKG